MKLLNKKILILGAGQDMLPAIILAKKMGIYVIAIDKDKNAPGKKLANKFINVSITNFEKNLKIAKTFKVNSVISLCSDRAVPVLAKICEKLNFKGHSTQLAELATNKILMKKRFKEKKILSSDFAAIENKKDVINFVNNKKFPFVLKPANSFGAKGIFLIKNLNDIEKKIKISKKICSEKKCLIEKFHQGKEINVVALVKDKKIKFLSLSIRKTKWTKNFGIAYEHIYPASQNKVLLSNIKRFCSKAISAIEFKNGVVYPQVMISNNKIYMIEIAARIPGGYMRELAYLVSGYDPVDFLIRNALNLKKDILKTSVKKKAVFIKFLTKNELGKKKILKVTGISDAKKTKGIYDIFYKNNAKITDLRAGNDRLGAIIAYGRDLSSAKNNFKLAFKKIKFN